MIKKITFAALSVLLLAIVLHSCKKEKVIIPAEPVKEINGSWKIVKAMRNGADMTNRFDFSRFRINFSDSTYQISNPVPFIQTGEGTWSFDEANYPFRMSFRSAGDTVKSSEIVYPVKNGVRNIVISFSPGCAANIYEYTLEKEN
jgi:hypothetical protein